MAQITANSFQSPSPESGSGHGAYVVMLSSVAALGGFLFGFDSGVINGTVESLQRAFHASHVGTGFAVASVLLGCAVGAFIAGNVADRFGRKPVMQVTAVIFLISSIGSGAAVGVTDFNLYRLIGGVAVGAASVLAPAYIAEIAPAQLRGRLGSLQQLAIVVGLFTAFLSNWLIARAAGSADARLWFDVAAWRWMFWVEAVPSLLFLVGAMLIPESPRFLVSVGKLDRAAEVFARTLGGNVRAKIAEVQKSLEGVTRRRISDILDPRTRRVRPIVWVGVTLSAFQQFVGINVIFYYGAVLWQAAGATEQQALQINLLTGMTNILSTFLAIALIDRIGRKPLLIIGSIGMTVTLATVGIVFATAAHGTDGQLELTRNAAIVALLAANLYIVSFGMSWGPVVWVMLGEMFGNSFRGAGLAVAASAQWLANFAVTMTFPLLLAGIGLAGAYGLYTAAALMSAGFVLLLVRETRGRVLEEM